MEWKCRTASHGPASSFLGGAENFSAPPHILPTDDIKVSRLKCNESWTGFFFADTLTHFTQEITIHLKNRDS